MRPSSFLVFLLALVAGCQCAQSPVNQTLRAEGEACETDEQCETSLCDKLPGKSSVCFRRCAAGCKANEICTALQLNDRFVCVPERQGLCQPCTLNIDCTYPGDRCAQVGGATVCTRDCSFDGQCPSSYRCADGLDSQGNSFIKQCQPTSGTCDCTVVSAGQTRPCAESNSTGTCMGNQTCRPPDGYDTCSAPIPQAELCNGRDDDCNGQVDEGIGMVTCGTGECQRTVSTCQDGGMQSCIAGAPTTEVCDGKDNDCDGTVDNGVDTSTSLLHCGACNTPCTRPNAVPVCAAGMCGIASCLPGFINLDGNQANGCEYACTVSSSTDAPDLSLVDANCDGIDGEVGNAIFVAPPAAGGNDSNTGTRTQPKATLTAGLAAAVAQNKRDVLVASGTYVEQVSITAAGKGVYGGYTAGTWARSLSTAVTVTGVNSPLRIANAANVTVQLMSFIGANAIGAGASAYGAFIVDSPGVTLGNVTLSAGSGSAGTNGTAGTIGVSGLAGGPGAPGCEESGGLLCNNCPRPSGGPGGTNTSCFRTGGSGGLPGNGSAVGSPGNPGAGGTLGGPGTPSGFGNWVTPSTYWGANGNTPTMAGTGGTSGATFGALSALGYTRAAATNGGSGPHGDGGGGGGGGGGGTSSCNSYGGAGSGGGAGGCGGSGGTAGLSGGASIAVFVWNSTVSATGCAVTSANGGTGGNGGAGGNGGTGGNGGPRNAYGGSGEQDDGSNGGNGGRGGNGASGGAGGAGGGGPTLGVARGGGGVWSASTTTITTGIAGAGGTSVAGAGATGVKQDVY